MLSSKTWVNSLLMLKSLTPSQITVTGVEGDSGSAESDIKERKPWGFRGEEKENDVADGVSSQ